MKRLVLLIAIVAAAAVIAFVIVRTSRRSSPSAVFALLPHETLAVGIAPDVRRLRAGWHETDIYKLWREPAVQEFLQTRETAEESTAEASHVLDQLDDLGATDAFVAVTAIESAAWKIVGGFRFTAKAADAAKIVTDWRTRLLGAATDAKQETTEYRGHRIQTDSVGIANISTVFTDGWLFAANDIDQLKLLVDRADGQQTEKSANLLVDEVFSTARRHMPARYEALFYIRPEALLTALNGDPAVATPAGAIRNLQSLCVAMNFDQGKIRDRAFVATPRMIDGSISRAPAKIGTKETWFYFDALTDLGGLVTSGSAGVAQPWISAFQSSGITADEWNGAFASEFGVLADWPAESRWPIVLATVPVKDAARAKQLGDRLAASSTMAGTAVRGENGVRYFDIPSSGQMFAIAPTIGLSDRVLVGGFGPESVEAAIARVAAGEQGLGAQATYKRAEAAVPVGTQSFAYVDTALFYARLDAAARPMLLMGAAFMPALRNAVDLSKLPPAEVITKHLSPISMSQRFDGEGYVSESIGPVSFTQVVAGVAAAAVGATIFYQKQTGGMPPRLLPPMTLPSPSPFAARPSPTPR
jgi:hypothetical protein